MASVGTVRDVTTTFGDIVVSDSRLDDATTGGVEASREPQKSEALRYSKRFWVSLHHIIKKELICILNEKKYLEAIEAFDNALEDRQQTCPGLERSRHVFQRDGRSHKCSQILVPRR